jgi:hypothetical protein
MRRIDELESIKSHTAEVAERAQHDFDKIKNKVEAGIKALQAKLDQAEKDTKATKADAETAAKAVDAHTEEPATPQTTTKTLSQSQGDAYDATVTVTK